MRVRILTEWAGSPPCGAEADLPDALARDQIGRGYAEAVAVPPAREPETTSVAPGEQAILPKGRRR